MAGHLIGTLRRPICQKFKEAVISQLEDEWDLPETVGSFARQGFVHSQTVRLLLPVSSARAAYRRHDRRILAGPSTHRSSFALVFRRRIRYLLTSRTSLPTWRAS